MEIEIFHKLLPWQNPLGMHQIFHRDLMKISWFFFVAEIVSFFVYVMEFYTTERCTYRIEYRDNRLLT